MTEQVNVLKLVLSELELGHVINTMDDRIEIQKAVCMVQESGLQLGYSYNWYVRGPYSPSLASDYYSLSQSSDNSSANLVLTDYAKTIVQRVKPLLLKPDQFPLSRVYWLELLASIIYLCNKLRMDDATARAKIAQSKPRLHPHFDIAKNKLVESGLL